MSETSVAERFFVDAMSPGFREDPYPHYESYRSEEPLLRVDDTMWFALAHQDVTTLLRHPKLSSDETRATTEKDRPEPGRLKARSLLFMDPPDHTRLRRMVARAFTPKRVENLRATAQATTSGLLDQLEIGCRSPVDLIEGLAYPLPVRIICSLLGVPASDEEAFTGWSRSLSRALDPSVLRSATVDSAIAKAEKEIVSYLEDILVLRRRKPGTDLLSALLATEADDDQISSTEIVDLALLLLVAGHETTVNLIGNGILALLAAPDQTRLLRSSPHLLAGAVDEFLRFDSPVQMTQRIAIEDLDLAGYRVRAGDEIVLVLGAANRDPSAFDEPHELRIDRAARRHVAFGGGIHYCLGATLARMEAEVAISGLLHRFERIESAGPAGRRPNFTLRGLASLPAILTTAT